MTIMPVAIPMITPIGRNRRSLCRIKLVTPEPSRPPIIPEMIQATFSVVDIMNGLLGSIDNVVWLN